MIWAKANANLALVKYWGKADATAGHPAGASLSVTLDGLSTVAGVELLGELDIQFPPLPVNRLWIDVEESRPANQVAQTIGYIWDAVDGCGSFPCGIYTGAAKWTSSTGNTHQFSGFPLWYAHYDYEATFSTYQSLPPFGGWTEPVGKQYDNGTEFGPLCGKTVDYNIMYQVIP